MAQSYILVSEKNHHKALCGISVKATKCFVVFSLTGHRVLVLAYENSKITIFTVKRTKL